MLDKVITIEEAREIANTPDNPRESLKRVDLTDVYKLIHRFHRERGDINPDTYNLSLDDRSRSIRSTIGRSESENLEIQSINMKDVKYSMYSKDSLDNVMVDIDNSWNGDKAAFSYNNGRLEVLKSDYYTTRSFCELLYLEAINEMDKSDNYMNADLNNLNFRDTYFKSAYQTQKPDWLARGGTIGGAILANTGDMWKLILGRRSQKTSINPGRISIVPNGGMEYDNISEGKMEKDLKLKFNEELFRGLRQPYIFDEFVDSHRVSVGWDLRDGTLNIGYALIIDSPEGYEEIKKYRNHNFQFESSVEIDVKNFGVLVSRANMKYMSPSVIPTVYRSISLLDKMYDSAEISYNIDI